MQYKSGQWFRALLVSYMLGGLAIALVIHIIVLSSPQFFWIRAVSRGAVGEARLETEAGGAGVYRCATV